MQTQYTHNLAYTCTHTHARIHTCTRTHTYTHTRTHHTSFLPSLTPLLSLTQGPHTSILPSYHQHPRPPHLHSCLHRCALQPLAKIPCHDHSRRSVITMRAQAKGTLGLFSHSSTRLIAAATRGLPFPEMIFYSASSSATAGCPRPHLISLVKNSLVPSPSCFLYLLFLPVSLLPPASSSSF